MSTGTGASSILKSFHVNRISPYQSSAKLHAGSKVVNGLIKLLMRSSLVSVVCLSNHSDKAHPSIAGSYSTYSVVSYLFTEMSIWFIPCS